MLPPGTKIVEAFDRSGGALLILGEAGSGKTTMFLDLARDLIMRAEQDDTHPIPVIFNLGSWTKMRRVRGEKYEPQSIADWLVNELYTKYQVPKKIGRTWVNTGQILPLLDGLGAGHAGNFPRSTP